MGGHDFPINNPIIYPSVIMAALALLFALFIEAQWAVIGPGKTRFVVD